jgi:AbrB family looped-hinge helix DNA binding protein
MLRGRQWPKKREASALGEWRQLSLLGCLYRFDNPLTITSLFTSAKILYMNTNVIPIQSASAKGQVTIPVAIRARLGIKPGSKIRFVERGGEVVLEKVEVNLGTLCGMLTAPRSVTLDKMDRAGATAAEAKFARKNAVRSFS